MQDYQQRVLVEKKELDDKLRNLRNFQETEQFNKLPQVDIILLTHQERAMSNYSDILGERIALFS